MHRIAPRATGERALDTANLPNNGWLLLYWAGFPRYDYKEFDWELGTCHNHRPISCSEI